MTRVHTPYLSTLERRGAMVMITLLLLANIPDFITHAPSLTGLVVILALDIVAPLLFNYAWAFLRHHTARRAAPPSTPTA